LWAMPRSVCSADPNGQCQIPKPRDG
jgi:hypothetical protein